MKFDLEKFRNGHPARCGNEPAYFVAYVPELGVEPVFFRTPTSTERGFIMRCSSSGTRGLQDGVTLDDPPPKLRPYRDLSEIPVGHWFRRNWEKRDGTLHRISMIRPTVLEFSFVGETSFWTAKDLADRWEHAPVPTGPWEPCTVEEA